MKIKPLHFFRLLLFVFLQSLLQLEPLEAENRLEAGDWRQAEARPVATLQQLKLNVEAKDFSVTTSDYCEFLNGSAAFDSYGLYDEKMDGIERAGKPGNYHYEVMDGKKNSPINYVSQNTAMCYYDWLENAALTSTLNFNCCEAACDVQLRSNRGGCCILTTSATAGLTTNKNGKKEESRSIVKEILDAIILAAVTSRERTIAPEEQARISTGETTPIQQRENDITRNNSAIITTPFDHPHEERQATTTDMPGINTTTAANPLALFETALQTHPNAERLVLQEKEGAPFIHAPASFFGNPIEFCWGLGRAKTESQKLGEHLRQGLAQKYGKNVAEIACPTIADESDWSSAKLDHALNMARIASKNPDSYKTTSLATKRDQIVAYAKDTAMATPHAHEEAFDRLNEFRMTLHAAKQTKPWEARKVAIIACVHDPSFTAAREAATKAALHATKAVQAAEASLRLAQKIASSDPSYGAAMVLKTATAHLAATKKAETWASLAKNHYSRYIETNDGLYGGISDDTLRNAFDTAQEATWTATDAADAYAIYTATRTSTIDRTHASAIAEAATARSSTLDAVMKDMEATITYASALVDTVIIINRIVGSSEPINNPLALPTRNMRLTETYAKAIAHEASLCCAEEKQLSAAAMEAAATLDFLKGSNSSSSAARAALNIIKEAANPCRMAATARMMSNLTRATKWIEHVAKTAIEEGQKTRGELYRGGTTDKHLDAIEEAEKAYQQYKEAAAAIKRAPLNIEVL